MFMLFSCPVVRESRKRSTTDQTPKHTQMTSEITGRGRSQSPDANRQSPHVSPEAYMIHELAIDPHAFTEQRNVQLASPGTTAAVGSRPRHVTLASGDMEGLEKMIKDQWYRALFETLSQRQTDSPDEWAAQMTNLLIEMRDGLIRVVPRRGALSHLRSQLQERVDSVIVRQMLETHTFNADAVMGLFDYLVAVITQLEAPVRHADTQAWWQQCRERATVEGGNVSTIVPDLFRFVNDKVEQIEGDSVTAQIEILRPMVQASGAEVERPHWTLGDAARTRRWLLRTLAREVLTHVPSRGAPGEIGESGSSAGESDGEGSRVVKPVLGRYGCPSSLHRLVEAMQAIKTGSTATTSETDAVSPPTVTTDLVRDLVLFCALPLISSPTPHSPGDLPETLLLDHARIHHFQNSLQQNIILGIAICLARNYDMLLPMPLPGGEGCRATVTWLRDLQSTFTRALEGQNITIKLLKELLSTTLTARAQEKRFPDLGLVTQRIKTCVESFDMACRPEHRLYKTVQSRILTFVWALLSGDESLVQHVTAREQTPVFQLLDPLQAIATAVKIVFGYNARLFADEYTQIVEGACKKGAC